VTKTEMMREESLDRARTGNSVANYQAIFEGFLAKGIAEDAINPRENVFTFNAWKALGRHVKKGEHGVKICVWIVVADKDAGADGAEAASYRKAHTTTVFHISQTETTAEREARRVQP